MFAKGKRVITRPAINLIFSSRNKRGHVRTLSGFAKPESSSSLRSRVGWRDYSSLGKDGDRKANVNSIDSTTENFHPKPMNQQEARLAINGILEYLEELKIPLGSLDSSTDDSSHIDQGKLFSVFKATKQYLRRLEASVQHRTLNPSGKHGKELSNLFELAMYVYGQLPLQCAGIFEECQWALRILDSWNLDVRSTHYASAIAAANRESRWEESSNLFLRQIDPEAGYNPVNMDISRPYGLYAISRSAQQNGSDAATEVFEAVRELTMVSPSDQPTYLLAAGTALGYAGEWESALNYFNSTNSIDDFGQPFVAGVMQACLLSGKPEIALNIYEKNVRSSSSVAGQWQWGGEMDRTDPLCRDLAMRSMMCKGGMSDEALELLEKSCSEGLTISCEALLGVAEACEQDLNFEGAAYLLSKILDNESKLGWIVQGDEMRISEFEDDSGPSTIEVGSKIWSTNVENILASVMRTCNAKSYHGAALFFLRVYSLKTGASMPIDDTKPFDLETQIAQTLNRLENPGEILAPTMVALCGLRSPSIALGVYGIVKEIGLSGETCGHDVVLQCDAVYNYALSENRRYDPTTFGNPWINAHEHIFRLTSFLHQGKKAAPVDQANLENRMLAVCMNSCTRAHQPNLALFLLRWSRKNLNTKSKKDFFAPNILNDRDYLTINDELLAEIILAHRWSKDFSSGIELFQSLIESRSEEEISRLKLSLSAGLATLIAAGRGNDAVKVFQAIDPPSLLPSAYSTIGSFLAREKAWAQLLELYESAVRHGGLSEDLSLLAMNAVVSSKVENRILVLRDILGESAESVNLDPDDWMNSRYWHVKHAIGFHHARLLMWWRDPETCEVDELDFAIKEFEEQRASGLRVKKDVIRVILGMAKSIDSSAMPADDKKRQRVPSSSNEWKILLSSVVEEVLISPRLVNDTRVTEEVVSAFKNLRQNDQCADFMSVILSRGTRVSKIALAEALEAAESENVTGLKHDLKLLVD